MKAEDTGVADFILSGMILTVFLVALAWFIAWRRSKAKGLSRVADFSPTELPEGGTYNPAGEQGQEDGDPWKYENTYAAQYLKRYTSDNAVDRAKAVKLHEECEAADHAAQNQKYRETREKFRSAMFDALGAEQVVDGVWKEEK